jgi:hypothetical protein
MSAVKTLFFVSLFKVDLEPSVAASLLKVRSNEEANRRALAYQSRPKPLSRLANSSAEKNIVE